MRRYNSFVPAIAPHWGVLRPLWVALCAILAPQPRRPSARPSAPNQADQPIQIHVETPPAVWRARHAASEARRLLRRYREGKPTSRRECMRSGMSAGGWLRARKTLQRAGVISCYDGRLLYSPRDAKLRLDVHLDQVEQCCWASGRYVAA